MNDRNFAWLLSALGAAGVAACVAWSCSDQPAARCSTGRGAWSAKYVQTSGADAGACVVSGEALFVQTYVPPPTDLSPASVAIGGTRVAEAVGASAPDPDSAHTPFSLGRFTTVYPGGDQFCDLSGLTVAQQDIPERPAVPPPEDAGPDATGTPAIPATTIKYAWDKVRFYVTASTPGTQLVGELTYTVDDCTATYHVQALYPLVSCAVPVDDAGTMGADETLCDPNAAPAKGRPVGSGIHPDLKVVCDPNLLVCVLAGDPPSLR